MYICLIKNRRMDFLKKVLASCLGMSLALIIISLIGFVILSGAIASFAEEGIVEVKNNSVLEITLDDVVNDYTPQTDNPFEELFGEKKYQLSHILNAIENAKYDDQIKGISIINTDVNAGIAQIKEIRDKLNEFKETGKFITAYADFYTQNNYYLSSVANAMYVTPYGSVDFKGLSSERLFFKDFQEKYGLKMEVVRHGKYKSAVEGYLENEMSDANREQITSFLNSIWSDYITEISESRTISIDTLNLIADELLGRTSELAVENNLLDGAIYFDQYENVINEIIQTKANTISVQDYIKSGKGEVHVVSTDRIAVLYAQGMMLYGKGDENYIGQKSMIKAIKKIREDDNIKGVVLRINSPGGAAITADLIWRQLELLKQEKPLVVSMGDVAASGGYWIATSGEKIFAEPTTITGSIGVFGTLPNFSGFVDNIGINAEQVTTNKQSSGYSVFEPINNDYYNYRKEGVEKVYTTFLERVSKGRNMTINQVDSVAKGRVWTGVEAIQVGLVDQLGGLEDAIESVAGLAGLIEYRLTNYPKYKIDFEDSFKNFPFSNIKTSFLKSELGDQNYKLYKEIGQMSQFKGVQAVLPYSVDIQ